MPDSAGGPDEQARASQAARRALVSLARDRGAEFITPQEYRGPDMTARDQVPLAGAAPRAVTFVAGLTARRRGERETRRIAAAGARRPGGAEATNRGL